MSSYKLTDYNGAGLVEPARYMFAVAGVNYEDCRIPNDGDHFPTLPAKIKDELPWGSLPLLEVDGKKIAQSAAIFRFLAQKLKLTGADDFEAAKCDELTEAMKDFATAMFGPMMEPNESKKSDLHAKLQETTIPYYMGKFNKIAKENGKWMVGKQLTWADLVIAHFMTLVIDQTKISVLDGYPEMQKLLNDVYAFPQVKEWIEKRPADTE